MLKIISLLFLIPGFIFIALGALGIYRFKDVFSRIHALSLIDNIGVNMMFFGLLFWQDNLFNCLKILLIIILIWLLGPVACHAIANTAYYNKKSNQKPDDGTFN